MTRPWHCHLSPTAPIRAPLGPTPALGPGPVQARGTRGPCRDWASSVHVWSTLGCQGSTRRAGGGGGLGGGPGGGWAVAPGTHMGQECAAQGATRGPRRKALPQPLPQQRRGEPPPLKDIQSGEGSGADMYCQNTELHSPEHWDRTPLTPPRHPPPKAQELGGIQAAPSLHPGSLRAPEAPEGNSPREAPPVPPACPGLVETVPAEGPIATGIRDRVPAIPARLRSSPQPGSLRPPCWGAPGCCPAQISCRKSTGKSPTLRPV